MTPVSAAAPLPTCEKCGEPIAALDTACSVCGKDAGAPNVRFAGRPVEVAALDERVAEARISANAKGTIRVLNAFGVAVGHSRAVLSKSLGDLDTILQSSSKLMQAYHPAVRSGLRTPQNNGWDDIRESNDSRVNPHFFHLLHYAALSLNDEGVPHYGDYAISLETTFIDDRTTVFEENPALFNVKHPMSKDRMVPLGYRAPWDARDKLAMAKLQYKITITTETGDFPDILLEKTISSSGDSDFIEVHIYGKLHARTFQHVRGPVPEDPLEALLWERTKASLQELGATWQEIP